MIDIPVIETDRLRLRAPRMDDFDAFAAFYASAQAEPIGGRIGPTAAFGKLSALIGHWPLRGYGRWVVADKETDAYLGHVGCLFPAGWPEKEIAWSVTEEAQGRGIAYEASFAARAYAYRAFGWTSAISLVEPHNQRSAVLAKRLGATPDGEFVFEGGEHAVIYRHPSAQALGYGAAS